MFGSKKANQTMAQINAENKIEDSARNNGNSLATLLTKKEFAMILMAAQGYDVDDSVEEIDNLFVELEKRK